MNKENQPDPLVMTTSETSKSVTEVMGEDKPHFHKVICHDGVVYFPKGINPDRVFDEDNKREWPYSRILGSIICQKVTQGEGLVAISKQPGFPPYEVMINWRRRKKEFADNLKQAFRDKAEFNAEAALTAAKFGATKVYVDTLKWAASVENPEKYSGQKSKNKKTSPQAARFVVKKEDKESK